jgi:hypothetical protein
MMSMRRILILGHKKIDQRGSIFLVTERSEPSDLDAMRSPGPILCSADVWVIRLPNQEREGRVDRQMWGFTLP